MSKERVSWDLLHTSNGNGRRFYVDKKRVSHAAYMTIVDDATRLECFSTEIIAGTHYQRCVAVLEA